jgi:putative flavoprotein involved in K+ transport
MTGQGPRVPAVAVKTPAALVQLHASGYRHAGELPPGGVLVVGAGPSGQQLALELARAGRRVILAVGRHTRVPRRYRDRDIWFWLDEIGNLDDRIDEIPAPDASRGAPSLSLTGANGGEELDLGKLSDLGVVVTGRLRGFDGSRASFADDLAFQVAESDRRIRRVLDRIDRHIGADEQGEALPELTLPTGPRRIDLRTEGIETVIWATGYRRLYPWLRVPVFNELDEIGHRRGVTCIPGVFALGLRFQHKRKSHFIGGVGEDAEFLADVLTGSQQADCAA